VKREQDSGARPASFVKPTGSVGDAKAIEEESLRKCARITSSGKLPRPFPRAFKNRPYANTRICLTR
jgi:hypothetical protein